MRLLAAALWIITAGLVLAGAQTLICFGNEPSWSVNFNGPDIARLSVPGIRSRQFRGSETRNGPLRERVWRGRAGGVLGDAVLFLKEGTCSDGMSDVTHPMSARLSMPDGSFFVGCCRLPGGPSETTTPERTVWQLVRLTEQGLSTTHSGGREVTVRFEGGQVSGFAGCNRFTGPYSLEGNRLKLGNLAGTMMACPEPAMTLERRFKSALTGTLSYEVSGDRLTLTSDSGSVLVFERQGLATLEGKMWRVTGYNNGREALVSPIRGTRMTLSFANGRVTGQAGCNTFRGSYSGGEAGRLTIGPAATTRRMCSREVMEQERLFLAALKSVVRWNLEGDLLHMLRADDQGALTATAMQTR